MKPSAEEIAQRIEAITPVLASNAEACVKARSVVPESMQAMVEAGLFRICQPARVGGYELSLRTRKRIEEIFGWMKTIGVMRKTRHRGTRRVGWMFTLTAAAYNLIRMRNLALAAT